MRCNVCLVLYGLLACMVYHMHAAAALGVSAKATRRPASKVHRGRRKAATDGGDDAEPADDDSKPAALAVKRTTHAGHKAAPGAHDDAEPATHTVKMPHTARKATLADDDTKPVVHTVKKTHAASEDGESVHHIVKKTHSIYKDDDAGLVAKARKTTRSSHRVALEDADDEPAVHTVKKVHSGHRAASEDDDVEPVVHHHKSKSTAVHHRMAEEDEESMHEEGEDIRPRKKPHQPVGKAKLPASVALKKKMQPKPSKQANGAMKAANYYMKMQAMEDKWNSKRKEMAQAKSQRQMQKGMGDFLARLVPR